MAHGIKEDCRQGNSTSPNIKNYTEKRNQVKSVREGKVMGSRRIFSPHFKLQVLDSYRLDADCRGNQRATARKYGIHRRQIQKWLQMESTLRCTAEASVENGEVALNLASTRQLDDSCNACSIPATTQPDIIEKEIIVDKINDTEDDCSSIGSFYDQDQALDFTCAALSKRRFFSLSFKLEVINAFYNDKLCSGNQRATARKFGIHRRQVQKWLNQESLLKNEAANECLDLSKKRKITSFEEELPTSRRTLIDLDVQEQPNNNDQETALCLVKQPSIKPEISSTIDLFRPYALSCTLPETPTYDYWNQPYCPYYNDFHTSCATRWLHHDVHYYKKAVNDISLYSPLYS